MKRQLLILIRMKNQGSQGTLLLLELIFYFNDNSDTSPRSSSSTPVPPTKLLTSLPPKKRRKISKSEEADEAIVKTLQDLHAQRSQQLQEDEEELFGKSVGAALRRMSLQQRAIAKLHIQQVLLNAEFPNNASYMHNNTSQLVIFKKVYQKRCGRQLLFTTPTKMT